MKPGLEELATVLGGAAAVIGLGIGAVSLFVLRVEWNQLSQRVSRLEDVHLKPAEPETK